MNFDSFLPALAGLLGLLLPSPFKFIKGLIPSDTKKAIAIGLAALDASKEAFPSFFNNPDVKYDDYILMAEKIVKAAVSDAEVKVNYDEVFKAVLAEFKPLAK